MCREGRQTRLLGDGEMRCALRGDVPFLLQAGLALVC